MHTQVVFVMGVIGAQGRLLSPYLSTFKGIDSERGGPVRQPYFSYRLAMLDRLAEPIPRNRFLGSLNVYKYGLWNSVLIKQWQVARWPWPRPLYKIIQFQKFDIAADKTDGMKDPTWWLSKGQVWFLRFPWNITSQWNLLLVLYLVFVQRAVQTSTHSWRDIAPSVYPILHLRKCLNGGLPTWGTHFRFSSLSHPCSTEGRSKRDR
jgi:hypothetical protein